MWALERLPFYIGAMTYLLVGASDPDKQYQKFLKDHYDNPKTELRQTDYCEVVMNYWSAVGSCKPYNIFIHAPEAEIQSVCGAGGHFYHGTGKRQSKKPYSITICRLAFMSRGRQCLYYSTSTTKPIIVSCNERNLPVFLDEVLTMSK